MNKEQKIKEVKEKLSPEMQEVFEIYCKKAKAVLTKYLQDSETDWNSILSKYAKSNRGSKKVVKEVEEHISTIKAAFETKTFENVEKALNSVEEIKKMLSELRSSLKQKEIDSLKKRMEEDEKRIKELESEI